MHGDGGITAGMCWLRSAPMIHCRSWSMVIGASTRTRPYRPASWAVMSEWASVRGPPQRLAGVYWPRSAPSLPASPRGGAVMRGGASVRGPPHRVVRVCWPRSVPSLSASPRGGPANGRGLGRLSGSCTWRR